MNFFKLFMTAQIVFTSYVGFTQIEFDLMSEPVAAKLYNSKNCEDVKTIRKILAENRTDTKIDNNALAIAYVRPQKIGDVQKGEKAEMLINTGFGNFRKFTGKTVAIESTAIEPNDKMDYFHYRVLLKIDSHLAKDYIESKAQFPQMARVQIASDITILDWLYRKSASFFVFH